MNRKDFFKALVLGGIVIPHVPKLIMTGGWLDTPRIPILQQLPTHYQETFQHNWLTLAKLREAKLLMDQAEVPCVDRWIYASEKQIQKLVDIDEIIIKAAFG